MKRIQSLDILRGATMALMVLVNNPAAGKQPGRRCSGVAMRPAAEKAWPLP